MPDTTFGISFIIASYNVSLCLERCVKSIQSQTLENIQIIIVNDKSTDNTLEIAQKLCEDDPLERTICISHLENRGLAAVRNTGVDAASLSYIWHIDGDDYLPGDNVATQIMLSMQDLGVLAIKFPVFDETDEQLLSKKWYKEKMIQQFECDVVTPNKVAKQFGYGGAFSIVYKKQFADSLNIKNLEGISIGEDQILVTQILKKIPCIGLINIPMYVYDKTGPSMMRKKWPLEKYLEDRVYFIFAYQSTRDQPWLFNVTFVQRYNYIMNTLRHRAKSDLNDQDYQLICRCWHSDFEMLKPAQDQKYWETDNKKITAFFEHLDELNLISSFKDIFANTEIIIHAGAHKTATTYIQSQLQNSRYDLALEGIVYIDYRTFRTTFTADDKIYSMSEGEIKHNLVKCLLPLLYKKPKRIIISEENLIETSRKHDFFSCVGGKGGGRLNKLNKIVETFTGYEIKIYYIIRDYYSYLLSMYCEKIKWAQFNSFNFYTSNLLKNMNLISWSFIVNQIHDIKAKHGVNELNIVQFEEYQKNPMLVANELAGVRLQNTQFSWFEDVSRRKSPSNDAVELAMKSIKELGENSAQVFYRKLVNKGYGCKKFKPIKDQEIVIKLENKYKEDVKTLVNKNISNSTAKNCLSKDVTKGFSLLSAQASPTVSLINMLIDNRPEDLDLSLDSWKRNFVSTIKLQNIENDINFNFQFSPLRRQKKHGISAMLRVKNEETNIRKVLQSCLLMFDEIIVVDNNSSDRTVEIVNRFKDQVPQDEFNRVKLYQYPFNIKRCGQENFDCEENSVHSLSYFYNYALSKCSYSYVCKWDGDMISTDRMIQHFIDFRLNFLKKSRLVNNDNCIIHGSLKGITVYKGLNGRFYFQENAFEQEVRLFPNTSANLFIKSILWEQLYSSYPVKIMNSEKVLFIEYKDVSEDEFSHWKIGGLGMGMRKRNELKCFNLVANLTSNSSPSLDEVKNAGFKEVENLESLG